MLKLRGSELSTRELSQEEVKFLDRNGYLVVRDVLTADEIAELRKRADMLLQQEGYSSVLPNPTRLQLWANRRFLSGFGRIGAFAYNALYRFMRYVANRWLFRFFPRVKLNLRADYGAPMFASGQNNRARATHSHWLGAIRDELRAMLAAVAFTENGTVRLCNLIGKNPAFDLCFLHPRLLAAAEHLLGPELKISSINYRAPEVGGGGQPLHVDWEQSVAEGECYACNCLWVLDDFNRDNGATRVVPGSHRWGKRPQQEMDDPMLPHPQEQTIDATAGSLVILNAHVWHGGTRKRTNERRRVIQTYCVRRDFPQQLNQRQHLSAATLDRLTPQGKYLLDVC